MSSLPASTSQSRPVNGRFSSVHKWPVLGVARGLEARLGKPGTREYVQVLRLLEDFRLAHVRGAVRDALTLGVIGFDAVKHLTLCRIEHRPPQLDLAQYPHLPAARVATTAAADYLALLGAGTE